MDFASCSYSFFTKPPPKPMRSLTEIAQTASSDLVISSCKNIEDRHPCDKGLSFDIDGCEQEVQKLQDLLKKTIPPPMWDSLFQAVVDHPKKSQIRDQRILFSTFIYNNVGLKKLKIGYEIEDLGSYRNMMNNYLNEYWIPESDFWIKQHVSYWLRQAPKLTKLIELDLTQVPNEEIIIGFSRTCKDLETITLATCPFQDTLHKMGPCRKLRKITCVEFRAGERMNGRSKYCAIDLFENVKEVDFGYYFE